METLEQQVAKEINEKDTVIHIGGEELKVKPLTLGQIIDISAEIAELKGISEEDKGKDVLTVMLDHLDDLEVQLNIALIVLYRNEEDRIENKKFIRNNLDEKAMTELQELYVERLNSPFFLTNIIFLQGLNLTKKTKTTVLGQ